MTQVSQHARIVSLCTKSTSNKYKPRVPSVHVIFLSKEVRVEYPSQESLR